MNLALSNLTAADWIRIGEHFHADQEQAAAVALRRGKRNEASLVASFRRVKPRSTTFNDQVTSPHRETNWKAVAKVAERVK